MGAKSKSEANDCLHSPAVNLKPHQVAVAKYLLVTRGLLAVHSTGAGKTLTSVASAKCLLVSKVVNKVVVLVKQSAVKQFTDDD
eukprot:jgi/Chrzof1/7987/UNPLg00038.t1